MVRLNYGLGSVARAPRAWAARPQWLLNEAAFRIFKKRPFRISKRAFFEKPAWQQRVEFRWKVFSRETNFPAAIMLLIVCLGLTIGWKLADPQLPISDLWPEMGGMTLDVFFILIVFALFEHRRSERQEIQRQRETIDDFKGWDSAEAHQRIAGAIRRLNRKGLFNIDFRGAVISDFSFPRHRIENISKSIFYDGNWGVPANETGVRLSRVTFDWTNCSDVQFSPFDPIEALSPHMTRYAQLTDCTFNNAKLCGAKFNGAAVRWTSLPPESHVEVQEDEDGSVFFVPLSYGPFHEADLTGASFRACIFEYADFRSASGIETVDFFRAEGLEHAVFDTADLKAKALASAARIE